MGHRGHPGRDAAARQKRLVELAVDLVDAAPATLAALERAHLVASLAGPCDGGFARALAWAERRGLDGNALRARALDDGATCDCEWLTRLAAVVLFAR